MLLLLLLAAWRRRRSRLRRQSFVQRLETFPFVGSVYWRFYGI
jgi:hypothetical protein